MSNWFNIQLYTFVLLKVFKWKGRDGLSCPGTIPFLPLKFGVNKSSFYWFLTDLAKGRKQQTSCKDMKDLRPMEKLITILIILLMLVSIIYVLTSTYSAFIGLDRYEEAGLLLEE